ncbi:hypothetical protein [Maritimibacter sp. HL-12]|uniref:hypothetical protein n=1 Tax=Maritimibacter sp. HL-12 TaxID=1162418 RepID=UPI00111C75A4|nr:hypothetical protein [Maritimibacter sp. HL-12]
MPTSPGCAGSASGFHPHREALGHPQEWCAGLRIGRIGFLLRGSVRGPRARLSLAEGHEAEGERDQQHTNGREGDDRSMMKGDQKPKRRQQESDPGNAEQDADGDQGDRTSELTCAHCEA